MLALQAASLVRRTIRDIPDFPKPGIIFKDITPLFAHPDGLSVIVESMVDAHGKRGVDVVVGIESRGFVIGAALAAALGVGLVLVRKPGKLPAATDRIAYQLEYGEGHLEIHRDALKATARALVVDDLLATGGTAAAAGELVARQFARVVGYAFVVELDELGGRKRLEGVPVSSIVRY